MNDKDRTDYPHQKHTSEKSHACCFRTTQIVLPKESRNQGLWLFLGLSVTLLFWSVGVNLYLWHEANRPPIFKTEFSVREKKVIDPNLLHSAARLAIKLQAQDKLLKQMSAWLEECEGRAHVVPERGLK